MLTTSPAAFTLGGRIFQILGAMAANMKSPLFFNSTPPMARTAELYGRSDLAFVVVNKHAGNGQDLQKLISISNVSALDYPNKV